MPAASRDPASDVQTACSLAGGLSAASEVIGRRYSVPLWAAVTGESFVQWCDPASECPGEWLEWRPVAPLDLVAVAMNADLAYVDPGSPMPLEGENRYRAMRPFLMHAVDEGGFILLHGKWSTAPRPAWGLVKRALWEAGRFFGRAPAYLRSVEAALEGSPSAALVVRELRPVPPGKELESAEIIREHVFALAAVGAERPTPPPGVPATPLTLEAAHKAILDRIRAASRRGGRLCARCPDLGSADARALLLDWTLRRRAFISLVEDTPGFLPRGPASNAVDRIEAQTTATSAFVENTLDFPLLAPKAVESRWKKLAAADHGLWGALRKSGSKR